MKKEAQLSLNYHQISSKMHFISSSAGRLETDAGRLERLETIIALNCVMIYR